MSNSLNTLEPKELWNNFAALNAVPRPSKKEERVIEFIMQFGKDLGLETSKDEVGNVIIKKPATKGMEGKATVALQSHLDMVHQKNGDTDFDFATQGIEMFVDGDWVKAKGTTLGADNGIGVASIMTILASKEIQHPAIEALFTIDEETGMTGALGLKGGLMHAKYMLNLDTEDDHELTIGCAGGVDVTATGTYQTENVGGTVKAFRISVKGLTGGHSGMDIHLGRGNANKLMNRILTRAADLFSISIHQIDGGSLRNAIPRESFSDIIISAKSDYDFIAFIKEMASVLKQEHGTTDPNLSVTATVIDTPKTIFNKEFQNKLLRSVYACPVGIYRMSPDIDRLVQTSNNLARVLVKDGTYSIQCLTRSSVDSEKMDLAQAIKSTFELMGASVNFAGAYPGWTPNPSSSLVKLMSELYKEIYKEDAAVNACHAGLECGILGKNYPEMEMISFGPNIRGAHSPDEKVQISSVQKYWGYLLETLKRIPETN
ncbi:cytosol nonspecific dipeptidase [Sphingobacteriaceae bacterium]|nr:cytosol nonspecific dipeptidase [Sphingobacteriaceae bacterium]